MVEKRTCVASTYAASISEWNSYRKSTTWKQGDKILTKKWRKGQRPQESTRDLLWPKQARPFEKCCNLWRSALKLAYLSPEVLRATTAHTMLPLNVHLGPDPGFAPRILTYLPAAKFFNRRATLLDIDYTTVLKAPSKNDDSKSTASWHYLIYQRPHPLSQSLSHECPDVSWSLPN